MDDILEIIQCTNMRKLFMIMLYRAKKYGKQIPSEDTVLHIQRFLDAGFQRHQTQNETIVYLLKKHFYSSMVAAYSECWMTEEDYVYVAYMMSIATPGSELSCKLGQI
jgi:hypothetical protein